MASSWRSLNIPRRFFWLFPLVAGVSWLITLLTLLIFWLAKGRPRYPNQNNPDVAFISDIGAGALRAFFIVGCIITGFSFAGTVTCVQYARYSPSMYNVRDGIWRKGLSIIAASCGLGASMSLVLLAIFDTAEQHDIHVTLLGICFAALALTALFTTAVWFDQTWKPSDFDRLRRWCIASNVIVVIELILGIGFWWLQGEDNWAAAGILEWTVTFIGCAYILCFMGYLWMPERLEDGEDSERTPLLIRDPTTP